MTTFRPSPDGGLSYQRAGGAPGAMGCPPFLNASSSQPGEIHSARLAYRGSFTFVWSFTGNCIVIPMGCVAYPFCRSCCLTTSMTQYCHSVELPQSGGAPSPSICAKLASTLPPPEDSFATSQRTLGWSCNTSTTFLMYAS